MDKFMATLNINHLRKQLSEELDETKRRVLSDLLTREEENLALMVAERPDRAQKA